MPNSASVDEPQIATGREDAITDVEAADRGADAVVGASFDYEEMGEGMLWITLWRTAAKTRQ